VNVKEAALTPERLRELLVYETETGVFWWRKSGRGRNPSLPAGTVKPAGKHVSYICIKIGDFQYRAHRLAWLYVYGSWPSGHIDHINGCGIDNRIKNLRDVDPAANGRNCSMRSDNTTGVLGVTKYHTGQYVAKIQIGGKCKNLGYFPTLEAAAAARKQADKQYGYHENHGRV